MFQSDFSALPISAKDTTTLIYRGVSYKVPNDRPRRLGRTSKELVALMGEELIYRGVRYQRTTASPLPRTTTIGQRLIYRGVTYEVTA